MKKVMLSLVRTILLVSLAAFLVSCEGTTSPTPTSTTAPTATRPPSNYPVSTSDMLGMQVEVSAQPSRIVAVHPTATEMLYRIGGTSVGRDSSSRYPAAVQELPAVGSAYALNVEAIVALKPDLVVIESLTQARMLEALKAAGAPVIAVRSNSLEDLEASLRLLGRVLDRSAAAEQAIGEINAEIDAATSLVPSPVSFLVFISDADRNIYAAKPESYPGAVADLLNLNNLAKGLPESGPYPGFTLFSAEQAVSANADVVFAISPAPAPAPKLSEMLPFVPGFSDMGAVKAGRVVELDPVLFLQAQGPRMGEATRELAEQVKDIK